jgi:restriction endonuclease S subunit
VIEPDETLDTQARGDLPDGWRWAQLGDLCERITDGTHQPPPFTNTGVPFLFVRNIVSGKIDFAVEKYVSEDTYKELTKRCRPVRGDILYSAVGSFGVAVVIDTDRQFTFQRHIAHLKPMHTIVDARFLAYYINSPGGRNQSDSAALGGAQRTVTLSSLARFMVPLPPLHEQRRIAAILGERLAAVQQARAAVEAQLAAAKALPPAYLRAVFESDEVQAWPCIRLGDVVALLPARSISTNGDSPVTAITTACLSEVGCFRMVFVCVQGRVGFE